MSIYSLRHSLRLYIDTSSFIPIRFNFSDISYPGKMYINVNVKSKKGATLMINYLLPLGTGATNINRDKGGGVLVINKPGFNPSGASD